jgi:hypothetical protein
MKEIQNQMKYSTTYLLSSLFAKIEFPYLTAEHFLLPTFQSCQYSSCHAPLYSSLHSPSSSPGRRQCKDSRFSSLSYIKCGALVVNITYWTAVPCDSLPTDCTRLLKVCRFWVHYIYIYIYINLGTDNFDVFENY